MTADDPVARAVALVRLFEPDTRRFGLFSAAESEAVPDEARRLLDHRGHMTVTLDRAHGGPVSLRVLRTADVAGAEGGPRYAREILLFSPDDRPVLHGIVRIDLTAVTSATARAIRAGSVPLGRILLEAGMLCEIDDVGFVRIAPGDHLRGLWASADREAHGRVARIMLDRRPAVELLEILIHPAAS